MTDADGPITWTDDHCHLGHGGRDGEPGPDSAELVTEARDAGVTTMIDIGTTVADSAGAIERARRFDGVWATAGVHPHEAADGIAGLADLLGAPEVVAVGECGLDYHYDHSPRGDQRRVFAEQIALAHEHDLALVIHTREAWDDTFDVLEAEGVPERTVFHCFTGGPVEAERSLTAGGHLSFSGIVTFPSADDVRAAAAVCPANRTLVETDAPFLTPVPHRGRPNRPAFVPLVGAAVAEVQGRSVAEVAATTKANASRVRSTAWTETGTLAGACFVRLRLCYGSSRNTPEADPEPDCPAAESRNHPLQPTAPLRLRVTIAVALVTLAALVAGGVARLDDRGEITTELVTAELPTTPTTTIPADDTLDPTGPPVVAEVPDKDAAVAAEWEGAEVAAAQLAYAEAIRQNEAAAAAAAEAAATPAPERTPAPGPTPTQPAPTQPPPTQPPTGGGNIYAKLDNIARCESGMNPQAYNPRGYYGAFQFSLATWRSLGESGDPRNRSYSYQREVAKRLQQRSGWGQWPHCSAKYGYR